MEIRPDYYDSFMCIAGACRHSCCSTDWEIDIDERALKIYRSAEGEFGKRLLDAVDESGECAVFRKDCRGRCPMLNEKGLCDIILTLGEGALCDICADHPRYRNEFTSHTELGIGLTCEEAARIILEKPEPVELIPSQPHSSDEDEEWLLDLRGQITGILQDRSFSLAERFENLSLFSGLSLSDADTEALKKLYAGMEILDPERSVYWDMLPECLEARSFILPKGMPETAFEQLAVYIIYRHLPDALYDGCLNGRILLAEHVCCLMAELCSRLADNNGLSVLEDAVRVWSGEVEYSDENLPLLLESLDRA